MWWAQRPCRDFPEFGQSFSQTRSRQRWPTVVAQMASIAKRSATRRDRSIRYLLADPRRYLIRARREGLSRTRGLRWLGMSRVGRRPCPIPRNSGCLGRPYHSWNHRARSVRKPMRHSRRTNLFGSVNYSTGLRRDRSRTRNARWRSSTNDINSWSQQRAAARPDQRSDHR